MALLCLTFAACGDKSAAIKKAFEEEGWNVKVTDSDDRIVRTVLEILLTDEQMEEAENYEIIWVQDGLKTAAIIKCGSSSELKEFLTIEDEDGKKDTSIYDEAEEDGWINGNCVIMTLSNDAIKIFKNA